MPLLGPGQLIDRYRLVRPLGEGGQAEVWEAQDRAAPHVRVALKVVLSPSQVSLERAMREAQLLANVRHPGLVALYGVVGAPLESGFGLVMELVEGEALDGVFDDPRLTLRHREALATQVAEALSALHRVGIVHRDLKPENVLLTAAFWQDPFAQGAVKVVDLGIAVEEGNPAPLTREGRVIGTPDAMAPERVAPTALDVGREATAAVDVFAWGVLAWKLLVGGHPSGLVGGSLPELAGVYLSARRGEVPWPVRPVAHPWGPLLVACLRLDPSQRPTNAGGVVLALRGAQSAPRVRQATDEAPPPTSMPPSPAPPSTQGTWAPPSRPPSPTPPSPAPSPSLPSAQTQAATRLSSPYWAEVPGLQAPMSQALVPPAPMANAPSNRGAWLLLAFLGLLGVLGAGVAVVVVTYQLWRERSAAAKAPVMPKLPSLPEGAASKGCECDTSKTKRACASRRTAAQGFSCGDDLPNGAPYALRLSFVQIESRGRKVSLFDQEPRGWVKVCTRGRSQRCRTYVVDDTREPGCNVKSSLVVSAGEIAGEGLELTVYDGGKRVLDTRTLQHSTHLKAKGVLCDGLLFGWSGVSEGKVARVGFFLDDP